MYSTSPKLSIGAKKHYENGHVPLPLMHNINFLVMSIICTYVYNSVTTVFLNPAVAVNNLPGLYLQSVISDWQAIHNKMHLGKI